MLMCQAFPVFVLLFTSFLSSFLAVCLCIVLDCATEKGKGKKWWTPRSSKVLAEEAQTWLNCAVVNIMSQAVQQEKERIVNNKQNDSGFTFPSHGAPPPAPGSASASASAQFLLLLPAAPTSSSLAQLWTQVKVKHSPVVPLPPTSSDGKAKGWNPT